MSMNHTTPKSPLRRTLCAALLGAASLSAFAQGSATPYPASR